ncbi:hypothetical protein ACZ90_70685 [Streptomyces albus subsp. albus]|uniref:hypothetical protein n=1 Tax=Streptomyces TaxID=1883 RepID=UPI0004BE1C7F|nr:MULTISPECIES: hypothetical protein [Streptomyces]KOG78709.1 hypothetical protein ADK33_25665 [Streptomyces griseus subsp. rhodochrous]KUJ35963.1 hypothetical protein ACZ90_70685 [Streptomyces albus subsp. albus]
MSIRLADLDIRWTGTDDTTPDGHVLALGTDSAGLLRLCLYAGDTPADDQFRGSLLLPSDGHRKSFLPTRTTAYGPGGAWVTSGGDQTSMLARLANQPT